MLDYIYNWVENIAFYLVLMVAGMHMIPGETYKKYIRFFVGMILILMLIKPIMGIVGLTEFSNSEFEKQMQKIEEVISIGE